VAHLGLSPCYPYWTSYGTRCVSMQQCYAQKVMMYGRSNDFIWRREYEVVHSSHLPPDDVPNKRRRSFGKPQSIFQRTFLSDRKEQNFPRACARIHKTQRSQLLNDRPCHRQLRLLRRPFRNPEMPVTHRWLY